MVVINKQGAFMPKNLIDMKEQDWVVAKLAVLAFMEDKKQPPFVLQAKDTKRAMNNIKNEESLKSLLQTASRPFFNEKELESIQHMSSKSLWEKVISSPLLKYNIFAVPDIKNAESLLVGVTFNAEGFSSHAKAYKQGQDKIFLGSGGYGVVQAIQWQDGSVDALKIQDMDFNGTGKVAEEAAREIIRKNEIQILNKLNYLKQEFIDIQSISITDSDPTKYRSMGKPVSKPSYIISKFIEGESLDNYFKTVKPDEMNELAKCSLALQSARAIKALHDHDIVHGDISLNNLMINHKEESFIVTAIDFGTSSVLEDGKAVVKINITNTPLYRAPETINQQIISKKTDIFSLGKLFEQDLKLGSITLLNPMLRRMTCEDCNIRPSSIEQVISYLERAVIALEEQQEEKQSNVYGK